MLCGMTARQFLSDANIARAGEKFLDRTLPKPEWTHAAHFAVTLWLIRHRPEMDLDSHLPDLIRAFNEASGTPNTDSGGYHETITRASLAAARSWSAVHPDLPLHDLLEGLLASPMGRSGWLLDYWSRERLFSVAARRAWLAPDLKAFPHASPLEMAAVPER
jgi:hypothetical protein